MRYYHRRRYDNRGEVYPKGGVTVAYDRDTGCFGVAYCSDKDVYNKKLGRMIAENRCRAANERPNYPGYSGESDLKGRGPARTERNAWWEYATGSVIYLIIKSRQKN